MADDEPRAGELTTANYGWTKPSVGNSDDAWGSMLNSDLDAIDSVVHGIDTRAIPGPSSSAPVMDGTASAGSATAWSRGDHVHPTDTSKYDTTNPAGYQTAAQVNASLLPYALVSSVPAASASAPVMDSVANAGSSAAFSRGDHVHPTDTSRAAASALASYLPLIGGTLTGNLNATSIYATGNMNAGAYGTNGAGGFTANISSGIWGLTVTGAAATARGVVFQTANSSRWNMQASTTAESGSNAGSDYQITPYSDAGAILGGNFQIQRASMVTSIIASGATGWTGVGAVGDASLMLNKATGTTNSARVFGLRNGVFRWALALGLGNAESGSNTGSDFIIQAYTDAGAGAPIIPLTITRSNQVCTFGAAIVNGPSDRSLKKNIAPLEGALDKVLALQGVSFNLIATPDKREIGLIAQDVEPVVPEIIQDFQMHDAEGRAAEVKLALDYPKLTALLIEAVKTLTARVEELEAARG